MTKYETIPTAVVAPIVEVIAPAKLAAGYEFDALYQGKTFKVKVPKGGVEKGDRFKVPLPQHVHTSIDADEAPLGEWKDGLFDCLQYGCLHPSFLNSICFPQILLAQVMTRMQLNLIGLPGSAEQVANTFKYVVYIVVAYYILTMIFSPGEDGTTDSSPIYGAAGLCLFIYTLIAMMRTRRAVRESYAIPDTQYCNVSNDFWLSFCCGCLTVSQLSRQTADYEATPAACCSETGLRRAAPVMIV